MIYQLVVLASVVAAATATLYREEPTHQKFMWESFKREYSKNYESMDEENHRFATFLQNLKVADERNIAERAAGGSAVHGITHLSDLSQAEFESRYLTSNAKMRLGGAIVNNDVGTVDTLASLVDWTGKWTTPVKNQGYCGSCWAFSATEQIESDAMRTLGKTYTLSPEQLVQCDKTSYGCDGGWTEHAYNYVKSAGGITTEANYPYTSYSGTTGTCKSTIPTKVIGVTAYYTVSGESNMAAYVQKTGPLSVCLDASSWNSYTGGIMSKCGKQVDHCVQTTGVDATSSGYWKVRNSWGTGWGESGFIRLAYGANTCAITSDPTYVAVKAL